MTHGQSQAAGTCSIIVLAVIAVHAALLALSARLHSPTVDEPIHLIAGLQHLRDGRFDFNRGNPPLVDSIAAIPSALVIDQFDKPRSWSNLENAIDFIAKQGERAYSYVIYARWCCIPFSAIGAWVCWLWARDLYGPLCGVMAAAAWCFCPMILGHGSIVSGDVASASLGVTATYLYWRWLCSATWMRAASAGVALGLAQLTKHVCLLFYFLWPLLWLIWRAPGWRAGERGSIRREIGQQIVVAFLGVYLTNVGYAFDGSFARWSSYEDQRHRVAASEAGPTSAATESWLSRALGPVPVPFPRDYVRGILEINDLFERPLPSYLCGDWKYGGWWYFYLVGLLVKLPLGTWAVYFLAVAVTIGSIGFRGTRYSSTRRNEATVLVCLVALGAFVSLATTLHMHVRYIMPVLPFACIWSSKVWRAVALGHRPVAVTAALLAAWGATTSLWAFPHHLAYFNELAGGSQDGHRYLIFSNLDWGQDLLFLKEWIANHGDQKPFHLAYFGSHDPRVAGIAYRPVPRSPGTLDERRSLAAPPTLSAGYYAVSASLLQGHAWTVPDGDGEWTYAGEFDYSYFQNHIPVARAGASIFIYEIAPEYGGNRVVNEADRSQVRSSIRLARNQ